jgi:choloylglycine hydrolase
MDWFVSDMDTNLWLYPRPRTHQQHQRPFNWKSKYGSVVTTITSCAAADGMNEKGLVANLLYFAGSQIPCRERADKRPTLSIADGAVRARHLRHHHRGGRGLRGGVPHGADPCAQRRARHRPPSVSDASGDSAIFEYIDGKLTIHHGRQYQVMTNSPTFGEQLGLEKY